MHGSVGRGDTGRVRASSGPDFKSGFADGAPASNADVGKTLAHILGLKIKDTGRLIGRVLTEAIPGGTTPSYSARITLSDPDAGGLRTILNYQLVGPTPY